MDDNHDYGLKLTKYKIIIVMHHFVGEIQEKRISTDHLPYIERDNQSRLGKCLLACNTREWYEGWQIPGTPDNIIQHLKVL